MVRRLRNASELASARWTSQRAQEVALRTARLGCGDGSFEVQAVAGGVKVTDCLSRNGIHKMEERSKEKKNEQIKSQWY